MFERTQDYLNNLLQTPAAEIDAEMALKLAYYALSDGKKAASGRPEGAPGYHSLPQMVAALTGVCGAAQQIYDSEIASLTDGSASGALKKKLDRANAELAAVRAGTDGISAELAALSGAEAQLEAAQQEKRQALSARQAEVLAKQQELAAALSQKQAEIDRQQQENDRLRANLSEKDAERAALEADMRALEASLRAMDETLAQAKAASGQTENMRGRLEAFKKAVKALFSSDAAKNGLEQQQLDPEALQAQLNARIDGAQETVDRLRREVSALVQAGEELTQEKAPLSRKF